MKQQLIALLIAGLAGSAFAATEADVDNSFNPYKAGMPSFAGLTAGVPLYCGAAACAIALTAWQ